jgi:hypothetical protein
MRYSPFMLEGVPATRPTGTCPPSLKGLPHTSLSLAKSDLVGKSKNRRRTAKHFKKFLWLLRLIINVNRNSALQRKGMEIDTFLPIAPGQFCRLSYWLMVGIWAFPSGFSIPFKNCQESS